MVAQANIKLASRAIEELKRVTGERTSQKAVYMAVLYFLREARQRRIAKTLAGISFRMGYDPLKLRRRER